MVGGGDHHDHPQLAPRQPALSERPPRRHTALSRSQILWPSFHNVDILDLACACWREDDDDPARTWDQASTEHWWDSYEALNQHFCGALFPMLSPGDVVWVHGACVSRARSVRGLARARPVRRVFHA